jgi:hypothetical protein
MKIQRALIKAGMAMGVLAAPLVVGAQTSPFQRGLNDVNAIGRASGVGTTRTLPEIIGQIINVVLGFLGILLLGYMLYAGFLWMTSGGSEDKVGEAKTMIKNAIIGLVIIVSAFALSNFVLTSLVNVAGT